MSIGSPESVPVPDSPRTLNIKVFPELRGLSTDGKSNIVFDINSCHLMEVEDAVLDILVGYSSGLDRTAILEKISGRYEADHLHECFDAVDQLISGNYLLPNETLAAIQENIHPAYNFMILNVSHSCQLSCRYCFADGGDYGKPDDPKIMSMETAIAAIDLLNKTREGRHAHISFFGGEPLLNWEVLRGSVLYAEDHVQKEGKPDVTFGITTNGFSLTEECALFMKEHGFSIMLSIDGRESEHNDLRPCRAIGANSWEGTVRGFNNLMKVGLTPQARTTITTRNLAVTEMADMYRQMGFKVLNFQLVQSPPDDPLRLSYKDLVDYEQNVGNFFSRETLDYLDASNLYTRLANADMGMWFCGIGVHSLSVAPNGSIYPCHRLVGMDRFLIGDVHTGIDTDKAKSFVEHHRVSESSECVLCWAKHLCRGGCYAENFFDTGSMYKPYATRCHLTKSLLQRCIERLLTQRRTEALAGESQKGEV